MFQTVYMKTLFPYKKNNLPVIMKKIRNTFMFNHKLIRSHMKPKSQLHSQNNSNKIELIINTSMYNMLKPASLKMDISVDHKIVITDTRMLLRWSQESKDCKLPSITITSIAYRISLLSKKMLCVSPGYHLNTSLNNQIDLECFYFESYFPLCPMITTLSMFAMIKHFSVVFTQKKVCLHTLM